MRDEKDHNTRGIEKMEDRRTFARIEVKIPLKFLDTLSNKTGEGQTLNISADGMGFLTKEKLPEEMPIEIWLDIPDHHGSLYARGEIVWKQALINGSGEERLGVRFDREDLLGLARVLWINGRT